MPIANLSLFLSVTFVVSASPGPMMLSCMSNGARFGMKKALVGMLAGCAGNLVLMLLSALGIGLLVSQTPLLFNLIKWLGAGYLIYLGWQIMRSPLFDVDSSVNPAAVSSRDVWFSGFIIAVSNPKGLIYFGALFPQFIDYQQPLPLQFFILTCIFLATDLIWMFVYALAGNRIMQWLKTPTHQVRFNLVSGLILVMAGLAMAFSGSF